MRALVDDLLALSRLEQDAAPASRELIDVDEILEEAAAEGRMISGGAHEIKITKVAPEGILGDFKRYAKRRHQSRDECRSLHTEGRKD